MSSVYNKDHFQEAGVEVPATLDELEQVAAKLAETHGSKDDGYSSFYFPGKFWYGALPFIWAEGGDIAVKDGDEWQGALDSEESRAGLTRLKNLVDTYSTAPADGNEVTNWGGLPGRQRGHGHGLLVGTRCRGRRQ